MKSEPLTVTSYAVKSRKLSKILIYLLAKIACKVVLFQITLFRLFEQPLCSPWAVSFLHLPVVTFLGVISRTAKQLPGFYIRSFYESYYHITQSFSLDIIASALLSLRGERELKHSCSLCSQELTRSPSKISFTYTLAFKLGVLKLPVPDPIKLNSVIDFWHAN